MKKSVKFNQKISNNPTSEKGAVSQNVKSYLPNRFLVAYLFVIVFSLALIAKSADLQINQSDELVKKAEEKFNQEIKVLSIRGNILDRNGSMLSTSVPMYHIKINRNTYFDELLKRSHTRWRHLSEDTKISSSKIAKNAKKFIDDKIFKKKYDRRSIFNIDSEDYWRLLADLTKIEYQILLEKVRYNHNSEFLKSEKESIQREKDKLKLLADSIGVKYNEILERLYSRTSQEEFSLAHHQTDIVAEYLVGNILPKSQLNTLPNEEHQKNRNTKGLNISGLIAEKEFRRFYPLKDDIAQLIGHTGLYNDRIGESALERSFNSLLLGKDGSLIVRKGLQGKTVEYIKEEQHYNPQSVVLSIDEELQTMAYQVIKKAVSEHKAESGTAVLIDIQTGEILAMANAPSYNPNNRVGYKNEFARNRAITDTFEPGSTVKPFTVLTALQHKRAYLGEVINTRQLTVSGHTITDVAPRDSLTLKGILQKSSNIGVSQLSLRLPERALVETYDKIGFGKDTGLGLGEVRGKSGIERKTLSQLDRAVMSYGYGIEVTPLQLARAYATLGSFGIYRPVSITKVDPPVIGERVLPEKVTREVVKMMESVADKGEGGAKAAVDGYRVAIKTGTAKKTETKKGENGKNITFYVDKYIAYTAGIAPASDPRFALVVLVNDPKGAYYGGAVSAPLFSKIMGYTLKSYKIKPDKLGE